MLLDGNVNNNLLSWASRGLLLSGNCIEFFLRFLETSDKVEVGGDEKPLNNSHKSQELKEANRTVILSVFFLIILSVAMRFEVSSVLADVDQLDRLDFVIFEYKW